MQCTFEVTYPYIYRANPKEVISIVLNLFILYHSGNFAITDIDQVTYMESGVNLTHKGKGVLVSKVGHNIHDSIYVDKLSKTYRGT